MKKHYEELEAEIIRFESDDVVTNSATETPVAPAGNTSGVTSFF